MRKSTDPIFQTLFPARADASQMRKVQIVEGAIRNYVEIGVENTTLERIAKTCRISRPLITHYFRDKGEVFDFAIQVIRADLQAFALRALESESTMDLKLGAYIRSVFAWAETSPDYAKVWLLFFHYASMRSRDRARHSELTDIGHQRICALITAGCAQGNFAPVHTARAAKLIQALITGGVLTCLTESGNFDKGMLMEDVVSGCLVAAGAPSPAPSKKIRKGKK